MSDAVVVVDHVTKRFGSTVAVDDLGLEVERGTFVSIVGPSGCGKTTTLRMIGGFEEPTSGSVFIDGKSMAGIPPNRRPTNMCFQRFALFPHMNVAENIAYPLRVRKVPEDEIGRRVQQMLSLVDLEGLERRRVSQLSGGQAQRVALARALVNEPTVLLLDEPLGALDLKLRRQMQVELRRIQHRLKTTFIYVTHDQEEALTMSDRIIIMNQGRLVQEGRPQDIYTQPASEFTADFIGEANLLRGVVTEDARVKCEDDFIVHAELKPHRRPGDEVLLSIRPERIRLLPADAPQPGGNTLPGRVSEAIFIGPIVRYTVSAAGRDFRALQLSSGTGYAPAEGDVVTVNWSPADSSDVGEESRTA